MITLSPSSTSSTAALTDALRPVAARMRAALIELLAQTVGTELKSVNIQRELGLDRKLAWQLYRLVVGDDVVAEIVNLPRKRAFGRVLTTFRERGVREELVERLEHEYDNFDRLVMEHACDRASMNAMIAGLSPEQSDPLGIKTRKSLFDVQSQVWGYRAKAVYGCTLHKLSSSMMMDSCSVAGCTGLHALRADVSIRISSSTGNESYGDFRDFALMPDFCKGVQLSPLQEWHDGKQATISCTDIGRSAIAEFVRRSLIVNQPTISTPDEHNSMLAQTGSRISIPCEVMYKDLLVPHGWTNPATSRVQMFFAASNPEDLWKKYPGDLLPIRESVTYRGRVRPGAAEESGETLMPTIPEVPRYRELLRTVVTDLGWQDMAFDVYRCRIEYPIPHSLIELRVDGVKMKP